MKLYIFDQFLTILKKFICPAFCFNCRKFLNENTADMVPVFCDSCTEKITPIVSTTLEVTKKYKLTVHAISDYKDPLRSLVLAKSKSDYSASILLAQLIWKYSAIKNIEFDYLIPVPLHWTRYALRGFNQAKVISGELAKLSNKPELNCLKRIRRTVFQSLLSGQERKNNVFKAFSCNIEKKFLKNKTIILVDDLMTTGSTLVESAKVLVQQEPKEIHAVVACRVLS